MQPFTKHTGPGVPIDDTPVDTNQLCPTRFNKLASDDPYLAKVLFHDQRFDTKGENPTDFILNRAPYDQASIIVADEVWGIGSSRESAVYAMQKFGICAVIAANFGEIHYNNCIKNGLLPVTLPLETCRAIRASLKASPGAQITVDLTTQTVSAPDGSSHSFKIHPLSRKCLLEGLDDIELTLTYKDRIADFEAQYLQDYAHLIPPRTA